MDMLGLAIWQTTPVLGIDNPQIELLFGLHRWDREFVAG
jgi:hypothetical protein